MYGNVIRFCEHLSAHVSQCRGEGGCAWWYGVARLLFLSYYCNYCYFCPMLSLLLLFLSYNIATSAISMVLLLLLLLLLQYELYRSLFWCTTYINKLVFAHSGDVFHWHSKIVIFLKYIHRIYSIRDIVCLYCYANTITYVFFIVCLLTIYMHA